MTLDQRLKAHPGEFFLDPEDKQVAEFMAQHGLLQMLDPEPHKREWTQTLQYTDHPTHYIAIRYCTGFAKKSDNGYGLVALPKRVYSPRACFEFFNQWVVRNARGPTTVEPMNLEDTWGQS